MTISHRGEGDSGKTTDKEGFSTTDSDLGVFEINNLTYNACYSYRKFRLN